MPVFCKICANPPQMPDHTLCGTMQATRRAPAVQVKPGNDERKEIARQDMRKVPGNDVRKEIVRQGKKNLNTAAEK